MSDGRAAFEIGGFWRFTGDVDPFCLGFEPNGFLVIAQQAASAAFFAEVDPSERAEVDKAAQLLSSAASMAGDVLRRSMESGTVAPALGAFVRVATAWAVLESLAPSTSRAALVQLARKGRKAQEQQAKASAKGAEARRNKKWREDAAALWEQHPTMLLSKVANEIATSSGDDPRSIMRAIRELRPPSAPADEGPAAE